MTTSKGIEDVNFGFIIKCFKTESSKVADSETIPQWGNLNFRTDLVEQLSSQLHCGWLHEVFYKCFSHGYAQFHN